jgi:hypothetical protein
MHRQTVVAMPSRVLQQPSAELQQWLYDLIREVLVWIHVAFLDPPLLLSTAGLFV